MAAAQTITLTAVPPTRLADSLGLAAGDRQVGDVLVLSNSDALALVRAGVATYGSAAQDADLPGTGRVGAPVVLEPDPVDLAVQQAIRDATAAIKAAAEAELAILNKRTTPLGGAHLVSGSSNRVRENFVDVSDWAITTTGGANAPTYALAGGVLTVTMGATAGAELVLTSRFRISAPARALVFHAMSQKVANQSFSFELVADDDEDPAVQDELTVAAWRFAGSDSTTATLARYDVNNGLPSRLVSGNVTVTDHVGTAPKAIHEIQVESDETRWFSRAIDSLSTRGSSYVRQMVSPDPARLYRVRLRFTNGSTAPTGGTTMTVGGVVVQDYTEIVTEISGSRGSTTVDESVPVNLTGTGNAVNINGNPALAVIANETTVTSTALTASQSVNHATIDEGTNATVRANRTRVMVQATAAALGSVTNLILQESEDNTTFREVWRCPIPVDGQVHTFDLPLRTRYRRWVSTNGATALTAYLVKERGVRFDGAADIDKAISFPLTPAAGAALAASGQFATAAIDLGANHLWDKVRAFVQTDQATASNGVFLQQSVDGTNWNTVTVRTHTAGQNSMWEEIIVMRYVRLVVNNSTTAQTALRAVVSLLSL